MKHLSIRFKITCWFTVALALIVVFTLFFTVYINYQVNQKEIRDSLCSAVDENTVEIEFYNNIDGIDIAASPDRFVNYNGGFLRIDNDFLNEVNEVYTALYSSDITLMYGESPISTDVVNLPFTDYKINKVTTDGTTYYVFDRKLTDKGLEDLWLRGVVSSERGADRSDTVMRLSFVVLPLLVLIASVGGYVLAKNALRPIQKIAETADKIGSKGNLKERINLGKGNDELHRLANSFNEMFDKLDNAFETERRFISDASHELRTPISVICAQCEYTLDKDRSPEEYKDALFVIERQSRKMSRLINHMLDFTRLEVSPERYVKEDVNLSLLTLSLCEDMALIKDKNITLTSSIEENVHCLANAELLSRLITNLISNAYRYGKENGSIFVKLQKFEGKTELSVADDGIGIERKELEKIFVRFYQSDNSRSGEGMGLGLAMAKEIAKFHNGTIRVESELNKGSVFTLTLPL